MRCRGAAQPATKTIILFAHRRQDDRSKTNGATPGLVHAGAVECIKLSAEKVRNWSCCCRNQGPRDLANVSMYDGVMDNDIVIMIRA